MFDNPVLFKELRLTMRTGRPFWAMGGYVLALGLVACLAFPRGPVTPDNSSAGRTLFWLLTGFQFALVCLLTPALAGTTLAVEKEQRTMEMLLISALTPREIVWGKFLSSFFNVALLVTCSLPLTAMTFMLGGVSPSEVLAAYTMIFLTAAAAASISVLSSAEETRTQVALFRSYGSSAMLVSIALGLMWIGWLIFPICLGIGLGARLKKRSKGWGILLGVLCLGLWYPLFELMRISWLSNLLLGALTCGAMVVYPFLIVAERAVLKPPPPVLSRREQAEQRSQRVSESMEGGQGRAAPTVARAARRLTARRRRRNTNVYAPENFIPDGISPVLAKELRTSFFGGEGLLWKAAAMGVAVGAGGLFMIFAMPLLFYWLDFQFGSSPPPALSKVYDDFLVAVRWLFVPFGMICLVLAMALSTTWAATTFAREREQRSLDLLVMTPLSSPSIVWGKFCSVLHVAALLAAMSFPAAILCAVVGAVPWWTSLIFITSQIVYSLASIAIGLLCSLSVTASRRAMAMAIGVIVVSLMGGVIVALVVGSYPSVPTMLFSVFPLDAYWTAVGWLCSSNPQPVYSEIWLLSIVGYAAAAALLLGLAGVLFERWFRQQGTS